MSGHSRDEQPVLSYPALLGSAVTRVLECGQTHDPVVVLLHGLGARADRWSRNLGPLARIGYRAVAIDLPGHGLAEKGAHLDHSSTAMADAVGSFVDSLGKAPAALVGTSFGGLVAAKVTLDRLDAIRSLVLVGSLGLMPIGEDRRERIANNLLDVSEAGIEAKLRALLHNESLVTREWVREEALINSSPGAAESMRALSEYCRSHLDDDVVLESLVSTCNRPKILVVWGRQDAFVPLAVGQHARERLGSELVIIEEAGHAPYLEMSAPFDEALERFLMDWPRARRLVGRSPVSVAGRRWSWKR